MFCSKVMLSLCIWGRDIRTQIGSSGELDTRHIGPEPELVMKACTLVRSCLTKTAMLHIQQLCRWHSFKPCMAMSRMMDLITCSMAFRSTLQLHSLVQAVPAQHLQNPHLYRQQRMCWPCSLLPLLQCVMLCCGHFLGVSVHLPDPETLIVAVCEQHIVPQPHNAVQLSDAVDQLQSDTCTYICFQTSPGRPIQVPCQP